MAGPLGWRAAFLLEAAAMAPFVAFCALAPPLALRGMSDGRPGAPSLAPTPWCCPGMLSEAMLGHLMRLSPPHSRGEPPDAAVIVAPSRRHETPQLQPLCCLLRAVLHWKVEALLKQIGIKKKKGA